MSDWQLPIVTKGLLVFNILVHVLVFATSTGLGALSISAQQVWLQGEIYRIVTSAFTHSGLLHIGMNMSSLLQLGSSLEVQFGSIRFLFMSLWAVFLVGGVYVLLAVGLWYITGEFSFMQMSGVGFSGVLFMYAVLEAYHTRAESQSFFGMCNVPARMFPFVLLVVIQLLMPGISWCGHVSGVIVGLLAVYGVLEKLVLPSLEFCQWLEDLSALKCMTSSNHYIRCDGMSNTWAVSSSAAGGLLSSLCGSLCLGLEYIKHIVNTVLFIIGCPVDSIGTKCAAISSSVRNLVPSFLTTSSSAGSSESDSPGPGGGIALGGTGSPRYARVSQDASREPDDSSLTLATSSV